MARYFAEIVDGKVKRVIVAEPEFINSGKVGDPKNWIETFLDGKKRYNYAGIGYTYDKINDAFIPPQPSYLSALDLIKYIWTDSRAEADLSGSEII